MSIHYDREVTHRLAGLLSIALVKQMAQPTRALYDRTWILFEFDQQSGLWRALPAGLAVIATFDSAPRAFGVYKRTVPECGWSYEAAAEKLTAVPASLLVLANKALERFPVTEVVRRLAQNVPLIEFGQGPRIIDVLGDPGG
jgi:hypothetical protein